MKSSIRVFGIHAFSPSMDAAITGSTCTSRAIFANKKIGSLEVLVLVGRPVLLVNPCSHFENSRYLRILEKKRHPVFFVVPWKVLILLAELLSWQLLPQPVPLFGSSSSCLLRMFWTVCKWLQRLLKHFLATHGRILINETRLKLIFASSCCCSIVLIVTCYPMVAMTFVHVSCLAIFTNCSAFNTSA